MADSIDAAARVARAFYAEGSGAGAIRTLELPSPEHGQVEVEALYSGVSRGTESIVFRGRVPPSEYQRMRAPFQDGAFPFPVKYGYASVGRVVAGERALVGRTVFCLYPHQSRYVVDASDVVPVPLGVPPGRAVLAANVETAINGLWDAAPRLGDRVCVVGAGVVGSLVAYLAARIPGVVVELVDVEPGRRVLAERLGVRFAEPAGARGEADCVIHASGSPGGLGRALELAGDEAVVTELSWYGDRGVELALGRAFHARRLQLRSSQVGRIAPPQRARWSHRRRLELALSLLADPALDALISGECELDELPVVMYRITEPGAGEVLCQRVRYPAAREAQEGECTQ
jgi:D-arabinose 1-dehydrogenase-like Zn-dependent alcohol dehydrogenase